MSRRYCFTINNYEGATVALLEKFSTDHCKYLVYGKEVAPETGTPHLQGFFTLNKVMRITGITKALGLTAIHLEAAKGTSLQASDYCKKEGDFVEFGTPPTPGQRTDLTVLCEAILDGASMKDVADLNPATYIRNYRGLAHYKSLQQADYTHDDVRGVWYYGPPGTGKSHAARAMSDSLYIKSQNKWFDGYAGETHILIDDLDSNCLGHYLKLWADKYAVSGEVKGGIVKLAHTTLIVTSNYSIADLWKDDLIMAQAIKRRFAVTHCIHLKSPVLKQKIASVSVCAKPSGYDDWTDQKKLDYYNHYGYHPLVTDNQS